jgi:glycosyltransferase involved in cell wall biosynthesis
MGSGPEISVVIPTRDRWQFLTTRALASALGQQGVDMEVIVVDDGSIDGTADRLAALDDRRLRVVRHEQSGGMAHARNAGIAVAQGEWIAFLDDDDLWSPHKLRTQLEAAHAVQADFVYSGAIAVDERGNVLDTMYLPPAAELEEKLSQVCVIPAGCSNVIARTELIRSLGAFDESFVHIADWDLWIRLASVGKVVVLEDVLVAYLLHDRNLHVVDDPSPEVDRLVRKHASADPPLRISADRLGYSRWVASQRSRAGLHWQAADVYFRAGLRYRSLGNFLRAADALLAKRASGASRRLAREQPASPPADRPDWFRADAT